MENDNTWVKCNSCKKPIAYGAKYWVCNVSTCNRIRTGLRFCDVSCWDAHLPDMNHRESWAEERSAPTREAWAKILSGEDEPKRARKPRAAAETAAAPAPVSSAPRAILRKRT